MESTINSKAVAELAKTVALESTLVSSDGAKELQDETSFKHGCTG
ncbi:MAG: hypothetical protein WCS52_19405 [bacterium]